MTSHKEASRKLLETILDQMSNISKPQYKFLVTLFTTIPLVRGKMIFRNLSRYRPLSEKTYARQFPQAFDFVEYPRLALAASLPLSATLIAVMDCTFLEKSGNHPLWGRCLLRFDPQYAAIRTRVCAPGGGRCRLSYRLYAVDPANASHRASQVLAPLGLPPR